MNNNISLVKLQLKEDGFAIAKNYMSKNLIEKINCELDKMFDKNLINGFDKGAVIVNNSYYKRAMVSPCKNIF